MLHRPLRELLELTYGPSAVLPDLLAELPGIREAFIFRSWAARRLGEPGEVPQDVDVLLVGHVPRAELTEVALAAGRLLHREVNITRVAPDTWDAEEDLFVRTLRSRPLIPIEIGTSASARTPETVA